MAISRTTPRSSGQGLQPGGTPDFSRLSCCGSANLDNAHEFCGYRAEADLAAFFTLPVDFQAMPARWISVPISRLPVMAAAFCSASLATAVPADASELRSEVVIESGLNLPIFAAATAGDFNHLYITEGTLAQAAEARPGDQRIDHDARPAERPTGHAIGTERFCISSKLRHQRKDLRSLLGRGHVRILRIHPVRGR